MGFFTRKPKDDFKQLAKDRRRVEDETPWFVGDDDEPDLEVESGIRSDLRARPDEDQGPTPG